MRTLANILPLALFVSAALFLHGDLGKWNDDYFFYSQFNPQTGEAERYVLQKHLHFWRPVYRWIAAPLNTALFNHDQANHIITAVMHGLTSWLVFVLMRRLGLSRFAAAIGSMLFLVYPPHFEVVLWNTAMFTGAATAVVILSCLVYLDWLERCARSKRTGRRWWVAVAIGVMAFVAAGMNEQPAAAVLAMAVMLPWRAPRLGDGKANAMRGETSADAKPRPGLGHFLRASLPLIACAAALGLYTFVHMQRHVAPAKGSIGGAVELHELPGRIRSLAVEVCERLSLRGMAGGMRDGMRTLAEHPVESAILGVLILIGAAAFLRSLCSTADAMTDAGARPARWSRARLIVLGISWCLACWLPIARVHYPTVPRLFYAPDVGLAVALAAGLDGLLSIFKIPARRSAVRLALASVAIGAMVLCCTIMIGAQRRYQDRWRADQAQGETLGRLVPDPAPGTVFVPLAITRPHAAGRLSWFDRHFAGPFEGTWGAGWYLRRLYRRGKVWAVVTDGVRSPVIVVDAASFEVASTVALPWPNWTDPHPVLHWDLAVPFEIDERGEIRLITRIDATLRDGTRVEIAPPITGALAGAGTIPERAFELPRPESGRNDP